MKLQKIRTEKTARYFMLGEPGRKIETLLIVCHGYAQLADEFLAQFEGLQNETRLIVAPEGLHRFYHRGGADKVVASWMTKEEREDDIRDYIVYLDKVYLELGSQLEKNVRVILLGFSQGAATASRWASFGFHRFEIQELILFCGFFPPDLPPTGISEQIKITVVTASEDKFVPVEQEKTQLEMMRKISPGLKHIRFDGKHEMDMETLKLIL